MDMFTISVCDFFPSDVRRRPSFYLVSFIVIRRKFVVPCQLLLEYSARERATHASVYCRCSTSCHMLLFRLLHHLSLFSGRQLVNDHSAQVT